LIKVLIKRLLIGLRWAEAESWMSRE